MKALLVHLAATAFVILAALFVIGDGKMDSADRFAIVYILLIANLLAVAINYINDYYDK